MSVKTPILLLLFFKFSREIFSPNPSANWLNPKNAACHPIIVFVPCKSETRYTRPKCCSEKQNTKTMTFDMKSIKCMYIHIQFFTALARARQTNMDKLQIQSPKKHFSIVIDDLVKILQRNNSIYCHIVLFNCM